MQRRPAGGDRLHFHAADLLVFGGDDIDGETGVHTGEAFEGEERSDSGGEEFGAKFTDLCGDGAGKGVVVGEDDVAAGDAAGFEGLLQAFKSKAGVGFLETVADLGAGEDEVRGGDESRLGLAFGGEKLDARPGLASEPGDSFTGSESVLGRALGLHVVEGGVGIRGFEQLAGGGEIFERTEEAGDAEDVRGSGTGGLDGLVQAFERGDGERGHGIEGVVAGGDGGGEENEAVGIYVFLSGGDGFEDDLRAFEREAARLDEAEGGQRQAAQREDLTDEIADAAEIARAGDESADFEHGCGAGLVNEGFETVADLSGEQAAPRERRDMEGEAAGFGGDGVGQLLGELQGLGHFFFFLLLGRQGGGEEQRAGEGDHPRRLREERFHGAGFPHCGVSPPGRG